MKKYQAHKSSLFLMELIIAIVFFALASSVCLQLFVKSHLLSRQTKELNTAVNLCSSAAESIHQCEGSEEVLRELMPQLTVSQEKPLLAYYDEEFQACYAVFIRIKNIQLAESVCIIVCGKQLSHRQGKSIGHNLFLVLKRVHNNPCNGINRGQSPEDQGSVNKTGVDFFHTVLFHFCRPLLIIFLFKNHIYNFR